MFENVTFKRIMSFAIKASISKVAKKLKMIFCLNIREFYKVLCMRIQTQHIAVMTTRGRLDWIDNPLISTDTFFYLSKCASLQSSCATRGLFANFAGYLV